MTVQTTFGDGAVRREAPAWGPVFALTLCVATLIASEFMPVSLLTPIAVDLHITEGRAGQAIAVSGMFAVPASLLISRATRGIDRRIVLMSLTILMMLSGFIVALAPNGPIFMAGRALIGIVIGGFWSMSAATAMRLVPEGQVPRALAIFNGGNALATTIAAPLGSFLGQYIGWRGAFFSVVPLAALALAWQLLTLPSMPAGDESRSGSVFRTLRTPKVDLGMIALAFFFMGQFALFTYVRPFLEAVAHVNASTLSSLLLIMGIAGLLGTSFIGALLKTRLYGLLIAMPLSMALIAIGLISSGGSVPAVAALLGAWGLIGTAAPVGWWTWLSMMLPEDAERGGGLMVAIIQLAITMGASVGGAFYDVGGYQSTFGISAAILCASALLAYAAWRAGAQRQVVESAGWHT
jgi:predicted MFS family arabinose efflux permease